jgi:hypothetical protein
MARIQLLWEHRFAVFLVAFCIVPAGYAFTVDQQNDARTNGASVIKAQALGQEFIPSYSVLDVVQIMVSKDHGQTVPIFVRIRDGTNSGKVLGVSNIVFLDQSDADQHVVEFVFPRSVSLIPSRTYVIDVLGGLSDGTYAWLWGTSGDPYVKGKALSWGGAPSPVQTFDFWFKEGPCAR